MIIASSRRALVATVAAIAAVGGALVAVHYQRVDLTLSHYDARGHLVVARRIVDSITPGWQQIGAVWLPLPHLLNVVPVQVDAFYRTGASAVAISIASFAAATGAIAWIAVAITGSTPAAVVAAAVFAFNPNMLYLQATPMTEPLLLALTTGAVALLIAWCNLARHASTRSACPEPVEGRTPSASPRASVVGWVFALACMTRYEAWPVTVCALGGAVWARWRQGDSVAAAARQVGEIAAYPALAAGVFLVFSRVVIGHWFMVGGFFVPENKALGAPLVAAAEIWWGTRMLSRSLILAMGAAGTGAIVALSLVRRRDASATLALSLMASAVLPWAAFVKGHPFRVRYMVPLLAVEAIGVGVVAGLIHGALSRRATIDAELAERAEPQFSAVSASSALIVVVAALVAYQLRPLDMSAPMVMEAQWDRPNVAARQRVTDCLGVPQPGTKIMASMGSLGHYMQETSGAGFSIRDFLHEGNGDIWLAALEEGPRRFADWVLIEEKAEGGDLLAERVRQRPHFLDGYARSCEGAGLALYERTDDSRLKAQGSRKPQAQALPEP